MDKDRIKHEIERIFAHPPHQLCFLNGVDLIRASEHIAKLSRKETLEEVISIIPGGSVVDPQVICDEIRELMAKDGTNEA